MSRRRKKELQRLREKLEKVTRQRDDALFLLAPAGNLISTLGDIAYGDGRQQLEMDVRYWQRLTYETYGFRLGVYWWGAPVSGDPETWRRMAGMS